MAEFLAGIDTIFYGRKSYEMMKQAAAAGADWTEGTNPFEKMENCIVSSTLRSADPGYKIVADLNAVRQMKKEPGKDMWLFGGASLTSSFMNEGLVDELWLSVHPILLGKGKQLFSDLPGRIPLELCWNRSRTSPGLLRSDTESVPADK